MKPSLFFAAALFVLAACQTSGSGTQTAAAPEMKGEPVSSEQLAALVYGKRIQDLDRADHWVEFSADGTAVGASRGKMFDMTYELEDGGWCRVIRPEGADPDDLDRYTKCQKIRYDGERLYFYDADGSLSTQYAIES
ncbi:MAG: hypothetical protein RIB45_09095 [Marivibrio sp.]|uniref:hypothetical protein n=1 Tax=Marivibrio sp. TaxID=2039719 RepID=UPI0032EA9C65